MMVDDFFVHRTNPLENRDSEDVTPYVEVFNKARPRRTCSTVDVVTQCNAMLVLKDTSLCLFNPATEYSGETCLRKWIDGRIWSLAHHRASTSLLWDVVKVRCRRNRVWPQLSGRWHILLLQLLITAVPPLYYDQDTVWGRDDYISERSFPIDWINS